MEIIFRKNRTTHTFYWLVLLLIFQPFSFLFAQSFNFQFNNISVESRLSHREVQDVLQDSQGLIWLATTAGLDLYDGYKFTHFSNKNLSENPFSIKGESIKKLENIGSNQIALFYKDILDSIEIFNTETFESQVLYLNESQGIRGTTLDISTDKTEGIFVLTKEKNQISIFQFSSFEKGFIFRNSTKIEGAKNCNDSNFKIAKTSKQNFLIYSPCQNTIIYLSSENVKTKTFPITDAPFPVNTSESNRLNIFHVDANDNLWLAFGNQPGLIKLDSKRKQFDLFEKAHPNFIFKNMWEDQKGNLMVNSAIGFYTQSLLLIRPNLDTISFPKVVEREAKINQLYAKDFTHSFFMATHSGYYHVGMENPDIQQYLKKPIEKGKFGNIMRGMASDGQGKIYFSTSGRWFELNKRVKPEELRQLIIEDNFGKPFEDVGCCANFIFDESEYLWGVSCGKNRRGRLHRFHSKTETWKTWDFGRDSIFIRILIKDQNQQFWAVTFDARKEKRDGALWQFNPAQAPYFFPYPDAKEEHNPLAGKIVRSMIETRDGLIWIGTTDGLVSINLKEPIIEFVPEEVYQQFSTTNIFTIKEGQNGWLYLGTTGGGLNIYNPKTGAVKVFDKKDGLPNNTIAGIEQIDENRFLLGTEFGLSLFDEKNETFYNFLEEDGITNNEFNRLSSFKDENEIYYFGGLNGINSFQVEDLKVEPPLKPVITKFYKYDRKNSEEISQYNNFQTEQNFVIPPKALYFGFEYVLPDFANPETHLYSTWLEGYEPDWTDWKAQNNIQFGILPPGNYTLHLKAKNAKNTISQSIHLPILINDYFYKSWWFITGAILLFGALIYFFTRRRFQVLESEKAAQNQIERKMAALELNALQAQMNPHFVFNALGAIQYYIRNNDNEIADAYLAKFAHLMRLFLESSKNKFINLEEEIKLIQLYIDLEKIRFEDRFEVIYEIDEDLDIYTTEIPSLLLQPFIENAINHGLFHKKDKGFLKLSIYEDKFETLICVIEDNGVGRQRAAELRQRSIRNYKSRGTQIVNERLEALKQTEEFEIEIEVNDLNENAADVGTKVIIQVKELE